jgi:type IV secretion system protein VirB4
MANEGHITDMFKEYGLYKNFCLTKKGTLIGCIELDGRDPDGLNSDDFMGMSLISRSLYQNLPESLRCVTQYYVHCEGIQIELRERKSEISGYLSKNRQKFLNQKMLSGSRLIHLFEIDPEENLAEQSVFNLVKHIGLAFKSQQSRQILADRFSAERTINLYNDNLRKQHQNLLDVLDEVKSRWDSIFNCRVLSPSEMWAFFRFLANMDSDMLFESEKEDVPKEEWDVLLSEGDRYPIQIKGQDFLKFQNVENHFSRMLSITRLSEEVGRGEIAPGQWAAMGHSPVRQRGNYIIVSRYSPLARLSQGGMFREKKNELHRKNMDIMSVFRGDSENQGPKTGPGRYDNLKPAIAKKMVELEDAENLGEKWGHIHAFVAVFGKEPDRINETLRELRKSLIHSGMSVVVESVDLPDAYKTILPAGRESAARDIQINTTQLGALSLIYKQAEGQIKVADLREEEAQYVFQSADGSPFYYSPFCGGRCVVIGVGPIRSGKSFTKNTLGGHFVKYGGAYRAIDIDPGSEPLAQFYRDEGAIFRIGQGTKGFNSFKAVAKGPDDYSFISHYKQLIMEMLRTNENAQMRQLEPFEQQQLDSALVATLNLPENLRSFSSMVNHCPAELQQKLSRWYGDGFYASLFDQKEDAVGSLDKPVVAFNLAGVKDDPVLLPLTISEITYRVTRMFEDPNYRHVPKYLDIDEAHAPLKIDYFRDYVIRSIRTWGKWLAGIGMWSQDPSEFLKIPDWSALRSAASTLFFMADPTLDASLYKKTFKLSEGEIAAIKELRPKREAYIVQRDIGVSKKILVQVEPEQHVIATSRPHEANLRRSLIDKYGIEEGIQRTIEELNLNQQEERATA